MYMAYTTNPKLPKLRMEAVMKVRHGASIRQVARYYGYEPSTVMRWVKRADRDCLIGSNVLPTESSRPKHHPRELDEAIVQRILELRDTTRRGAEFIHVLLLREGATVSLSSVKRTLSRHGLTKYSKWKKWHQSTPRPLPESPGLLVEADTVHVGRKDGSELYIYTLIDVHSRWAYALPDKHISVAGGARFALSAHSQAPFQFRTVQTDHGPEFSKWFTKKLLEQSIEHRHTRVRKPNDNAHIERFNRTIQEECIVRLPRKLEIWQREIPEYIKYYNQERPHQGIGWLTPAEVLRSY
jgi:transposase InsO family protein